MSQACCSEAGKRQILSARANAKNATPSPLACDHARSLPRKLIFYLGSLKLNQWKGGGRTRART
jgi:hypothetical protein